MPPTRASLGRTRQLEQSALLERHAQRFRELKRDLQQLEYFCKGTVLKRMMKCGKAQCACASDHTRRHGPYYYYWVIKSWLLKRPSVRVF